MRMPCVNKFAVIVMHFLNISKHGKSSPTEIVETLAKCNSVGRPIWKPMHEQPIYINNSFVTREGNGKGDKRLYHRRLVRSGWQANGCGHRYFPSGSMPTE